MIRKSLAIVALVCSLTAFANVRNVQINSMVECSEDDAVLADFVKNPEILKDEELTLKVMETPRVSKSRKITLVALAYMLQRYDQLHDLQLTGKRMIEVKRTASSQHIKKAKAAVNKHISTNAPWKDWTVDVLFSAGDGRQISDVGEFYSVRVINTAGSRKLGNVSFKMAFYNDDNEIIKQITVHPLVVRQVEAVVIREGLPSGHVIRPDDIELTPTWLGKGRDDVISDPQKVVGLELSRKVASGDMLRSADLRNPIGARRGDMIWVTANNAGLSVRLTVQALEGGRVGQNIKVRNTTSKKEFLVELTGQKEAQVQL
ncbi:flagella basal body P-ring formation protein FlgA [bacterium F16]|nr:flagella basal body P-ring formation protein FlgA [bacterium F16]